MQRSRSLISNFFRHRPARHHHLRPLPRLWKLVLKKAVHLIGFLPTVLSCRSIYSSEHFMGPNMQSCTSHVSSARTVATPRTRLPDELVITKSCMCSRRRSVGRRTRKMCALQAQICLPALVESFFPTCPPHYVPFVHQTSLAHYIMASVQQIVMHPYVSQVLKFWSTTVGRDKTSRAVQYLSRFLAWYYLTMGAPKETVTRFSSIKSNIGLSRKRTYPFFATPFFVP